MERCGPNRWLQIICGPRPPAAQWPRAKVQSKPVRWSSATRGSTLTDGVARAPEEISCRGARTGHCENRSHPSPQFPVWDRTTPRRGPVCIGTVRNISFQSLPWTSGSRTRRHSSFGRRSVSPESTKIVEAERQKHIFEQELTRSEKDLIGFRQEAEMQGSGSGAPIDHVSCCGDLIRGGTIGPWLCGDGSCESIRFGFRRCAAQC